MDLPPPPSPSAIEVTCEDDPLTFEWDTGAGVDPRRIVVPAAIEGALLTGCVAGAVLCHGALRIGLVSLAVLASAGCTVFILRTALKTGRGRLVIQKDALIHVPGDGGIPKVLRRSEVKDASASGGALALGIQEGDSPPERRPIPGRFQRGDAAWLAEVLRRWLAA